MRESQRALLAQYPFNRFGQFGFGHWHGQELANPFRVLPVLGPRDEEDFDAGPLDARHARQRHTIRLTFWKDHAAHQ